MKLLTTRVGTSALGAVALLCFGAIVGILPFLIDGEAGPEDGLPARMTTVLFFPFLLLMRFDLDIGYAPDALTTLLALLGLGLTLAAWTGVIHGMRWLFERP